MKDSIVFAALARLADAFYGPGATLAYILSQAEQRNENALDASALSFRTALDGCSLSRHHLVLDHRARKAQRKAQLKAQLKLLKEAHRQAVTALGIAVLLDSLPKRKPLREDDLSG